MFCFLTSADAINHDMYNEMLEVGAGVDGFPGRDTIMKTQRNTSLLLAKFVGIMISYFSRDSDQLFVVQARPVDIRNMQSLLKYRFRRTKQRCLVESAVNLITEQIYRKSIMKQLCLQTGISAYWHIRQPVTNHVSIGI